MAAQAQILTNAGLRIAQSAQPLPLRSDAPVSADIGSKTLGWGHLITLVLEKKRFDVPKVELVGALSLN